MPPIDQQALDEMLDQPIIEDDFDADVQDGRDDLGLNQINEALDED